MNFYARILIEIEQTVKFRPLTHVSIDDINEDALLRPNYILLGSRTPGTEQSSIKLERKDRNEEKLWS